MKGITQMTGPRDCQSMVNAVQGKESVLEFVRRRAMTLRRGLVRRYRNAFKAGEENVRTSSRPSNVPCMEKGDLVQVKSLEEINKTLDRYGYTKGCKFMAQMENYCGKEFRVAGQINKFFDEARFRTLNCKNTVLLDQVYCDGSCVDGCDKMCFLFWRTEWLEKLD